MRSPLRIFTGLGLQGLVVLCGWVAVFLMAAWGVAFLRTCVALLAAPGVPVELPFEGTGGDYVVRGENVVLDPLGSRVLVGRATLKEQGGPVVAVASHLQVHYGGPAVRVTVADLDATLERNVRGELNFVRVVPKPVPGQQAPLLEAKVARTRLAWVDSYGGPPVKVVAHLADATFSQGPEDTFVRGQLELAGAPPGRIAYQGAADGSQWFWLEQPETEATGLLPALRRVVPVDGEFDLALLAASGLTVGGSVEVSRRGGQGRWEATGVATVSGDGVSYPGWLRGASVRSRFEGDLRRARATLETREAGRSLGFTGTVGVEPGFTLAGDARVELADPREAWQPLRAALPKNLQAKGVRFAGPVAVTPQRSLAGGDLRADWIQMEGERLDRVTTQVGWDGKRLVFGQVGGSWQGQGVVGALAVEPETGTVRGYATAKGVPIQSVMRKYMHQDMYGSSDITVLVSGKASRPDLDFVAKGRGRFRDTEGTSFPIDAFSLQGRLRGDLLHLERAVVRSRGAVAAAKGTMPLSQGNGRIEFAVTGVELEDYIETGTGTVSAQGVFTGTVADWRATGAVELSNGKFGQTVVPIASGRVSGTPDEVLVFGAKAAVGNGMAEGNVAWRPGTGALDGTFTYAGGSLSSFTEGRAIGLVSLRDGQIAGTVGDPVLSARVDADRVRVGEVLLREVGANARVREGQAMLEGLSAKLGGGDLSGSARFDLAALSGTAEFRVEDAEIAASGLSQEDVEVKGKVSGEGSLAFDSERLRGGQASLTIRDLALNDSLIGSGRAQVALVGSKLSGEVQVGTLDRYLDLSDVTLDLDTQDVSAELSAYNIALQTFVAATSRWSSDLPAAVRALFRQSEGDLLASGHISGRLDDPDITGGQLLVTGMRVRGRSFGRLDADFRRQDGAWEDVQLDWRAGDASLVALGRYDADGQIEGQVELAKFGLAMLQALVPDAPSIRGTVDSMTALVSGTVEAPEAKATMLLSILGYTERDGADVDFPASAIFDEIGFDRRRARFRGQSVVKGLAGSVDLTVPWSAFDPEDLAREPIEGRLVFEERPLADLRELLTFLDHESSVGTVSAEATASGYAESIVITGKGRVKGERLAFQSSGFAFTDADFDLDVTREAAVLRGGASGGQGGSLRVDAEAGFSEPLHFGSRLRDTLTGARLSGKLDATALAASHRLKTALQDTRVELDAEIGFEGTAGRPVLTGYAQASLLEAWLPEELAEGAAQELPDIVAFRNFNLLVRSGSRVRSSTLDVFLGGSGTLAGSLSAPSLALPLVVDSGTLRLPTSRIQLDPGGVADVRLENSGWGPVVRTTLDVVGRTQVTARRTSGQYDRFDVVLEVRGDALSSEGLVLRARSEPPELSQEEIIALLGRTDLIRAFARGAAAGGLDSEAIRETIYGIALPSLTEGFFAEVANQLRLDFVRVDYNPFDLFSVVIGKELGKSLLLQASRQFQESPNESLKFDVRLVYRPPFRDRFLQQFRFSLGRNERVPWRLTMDWSTRF